MKGYKVTKPDSTCRGFKFEVGREYEISGKLKMCKNGFHFCEKSQHCFNYYDFTPNNKVFEVEAIGDIENGNDKSVTSKIKIIRELNWEEVLKVSNTGLYNTGFANSGYRNSGNWNSGDWNSGNWNSGDRNSGYRNSGYRNSGNWNSGNWNSGDRNSGDSNSGYRNSGAFCTDNNPKLFIFNKECDMTVKEWENSRAFSIMNNLDPTVWIPSKMMSYKEKKENPSHETTGGYLKTISLKESWSNMWGNLSDVDKQVFMDLPNFDSKIFEEITGIKT